MHPGEFFTRSRHKLAYSLLKKPVVVPVKIRLRRQTSETTEGHISIVPGQPIVLDFRSIVLDNGLPDEDDYTLEFPVETNQRRANIEMQMKEFDGPIWGGFMGLWTSFRHKDAGFVMLNPKLRITDRHDTLALLIYPSDDPTMPETNAVKYMICDSAGEVLVRNECEVQKNSFVLIPTVNERELLDGGCTMFAQAEQSLVSITVGRDLISKMVDLEHTQPLYKYSHTLKVGGERRVADLKDYWYERVANA